MAAAEFLNLRPSYFSDRRFVAKEALESRFGDVGKWLGALNKRRDLSVAARNQVLFDAVHLLSDDWSEDKANSWDFIRVGDLTTPLSALKSRMGQGSSDTSEKVLSSLGRLVERALTETHSSFDAFKEAEMVRRRSAGERFGDIENYSLWFSTNRPYLTLDLSFPSEWDDNRVEKAIQDRVAFFLAALPEDSALECHYGEIARQYIDLMLLRDMNAG